MFENRGGLWVIKSNRRLAAVFMAIAVISFGAGVILDLTSQRMPNLVSIAVQGAGILAIIVAVLISGAGFGNAQAKSKTPPQRSGRT
jgi:anti-sigma-K factor RskA